ncbi:MAG: isoprenoid biosynthesis glyoxalase ElbB [Alphaproteobacteria bacterium]|nr:isoprenoid biosynthesis glyoxalase ElbB [Alphaproteobacteria bacterium]
MKKNPKFAIVLSGCGRADGSEIHEATCAMLAIDCLGFTYQCFAPNIKQAAVVNHLTGEKTSEERNVLVESARLARGNILDLKDYNPSDYDAIVFPGGLGAVINWCDFSVSGVSCDVNSSVRKAILESNKKGVVIGAMCIAPVVIAKVLGSKGVHVTIGNDKGVAAAIERTGAVHENKDVVDVCVDELRKVVTTPAYMLASSIKEVCEGADNMIKAMVKLI